MPLIVNIYDTIVGNFTENSKPKESNKTGYYLNREKTGKILLTWL